MTPCKAIEQAMFDAITAAVATLDYAVQVVPFVADTGEADATTISRPCVQFASDPFNPVQPGAPMGACTVRVEASTNVNDDPRREQLQAIFEASTGAITASTLGPLVLSPHLVCGVNDATTEGGVSVDEDKRVQRKGKTYEVAIATIGT
jgi:hypothetical protein